MDGGRASPFLKPFLLPPLKTKTGLIIKKERLPAKQPLFYGF